MRDIFACQNCHAIYAIRRLRQPPLLPPFCKNCGTKFPPSELGDWLAYERAEPEWNVKGWLTGASKVEENVGRADKPSKPSRETDSSDRHQGFDDADQ